ncbi:MAG: hypothetical protein HeimAB125_11200 [Candidatus Heimdallarchaeota archaeon AB_125]|nr:MAG: hypothetical protein HeimAB125_11200 [Candidatus Heimdallarchaeota archaeon AB_125]
MYTCDICGSAIDNFEGILKCQSCGLVYDAISNRIALKFGMPPSTLIDKYYYVKDDKYHITNMKESEEDFKRRKLIYFARRNLRLPDEVFDEAFVIYHQYLNKLQAQDSDLIPIAVISIHEAIKNTQQVSYITAKEIIQSYEDQGEEFSATQFHEILKELNVNIQIDEPIKQKGWGDYYLNVSKRPEYELRDLVRELYDETYYHEFRMKEEKLTPDAYRDLWETSMIEFYDERRMEEIKSRILEYGEEAIPVLRQALLRRTTNSWDSTRNLMEILTEIGGEKASEALISYVNKVFKSKTDKRKASIDIAPFIAQIGFPLSEEIIQEYQEERKYHIRFYAKIFGYRKVQKAVPILIEELERIQRKFKRTKSYDDKALRGHIIEALSEIGDDKTFKIVNKICETRIFETEDTSDLEEELGNLKKKISDDKGC